MDNHCYLQFRIFPRTVSEFTLELIFLDGWPGRPCDPETVGGSPMVLVSSLTPPWASWNSVLECLLQQMSTRVVILQKTKFREASEDSKMRQGPCVTPHLFQGRLVFLAMLF